MLTALFMVLCSQFHQHFTRNLFARKGFSLVTFWRKKHFRTKNASIKCWWNWHLVIHLCSTVEFSKKRPRANWTGFERLRFNPHTSRIIWIKFFKYNLTISLIILSLAFESNRTYKLIWVWDPCLVNFFCYFSSQCILAMSTSTTTMMGTCFTTSECTSNGGMASGNCASGKDFYFVGDFNAAWNYFPMSLIH